MNFANESQPFGRLSQFTPLRYPGGKGKLASFVKAIIRNNKLLDGDYIEPYAGGAAIAMELLLHGYVANIHINDVSRLVHSFWHSVLNDTERLIRLIRDTPCSIETWDKNKYIIMNPSKFNNLEVGFATFFLNRTNRSGILNAGIIGGRNQTGKWKINARYNSKELVNRIVCIANVSESINLSNMDAIEFIKKGLVNWPEKSLIYLDPPYYVKGRDLYYDYISHEDHESVASLIQNSETRKKWIVSYDDVDPVRELYKERQSVSYAIGYSARDARRGHEVMFFCDSLSPPKLSGTMRHIGDEPVLL
jgi:DNA adenine methylase